MLRFLYTSDLHGDLRAYARLPEICREHGLSLMVNGGDMLPKANPMHRTQREFLSEHLPRYLDACDAAGVRNFAIFGNDDLRVLHAEWLALAASRPGVFDLALRWHELEGGYWIRGNSFVPDYPFGLKDWCLRDLPDSPPVPTRRPVVTTPDGVLEIADATAFFASRPTMGEHFATLVDPALPMDRCILVSHAPPSGLGLGLLHTGEDVGSHAVRAFIERHQPLLTLSGHIHESPDVGRAWSGLPCHTTRFGRTICHQPGQVLPRQLTTSIIEIDDATGKSIVRVAWKQEELLP